jgi:hypothetical protein
MPKYFFAHPSSPPEHLFSFHKQRIWEKRPNASMPIFPNPYKSKNTRSNQKSQA